VIDAGCGNGSAGTGGGRSAGAAPAGTGSNGSATTREQAVKFAECMRSSGVRAPGRPDASGRLTVDAVANRSSVDSAAVWWR
jgi:hypothetical protein